MAAFLCPGTDGDVVAFLRLAEQDDSYPFMHGVVLHNDRVI